MIQDLSTPESQDNPHHWAATLLAHSFLGAGLYLVSGSVALAVIIYVAWELCQRGPFWDSVLDIVGFTAGVALFSYAVAGEQIAAAGCFSVVLAVAAVGWLKRARQ